MDAKQAAMLASLRTHVENLFTPQGLQANPTLSTLLGTAGAVPLGVLLQHAQIQELMQGEPDATSLVEALRASRVVQVTEEGVRPRQARSTIIAREVPKEVRGTAAAARRMLVSLLVLLPCSRSSTGGLGGWVRTLRLGC
jgi:hypothetical protein